MEEDSIEKRKTNLKSKLFGWVKDNYDKTFLIVLIAAFIIRFLIFLETMNQPIWWDAGDYLSTSKRWGLGLNIRDMWYYRRGFFWVLWGALFFKIGFGEIGIRFTEVLFSTGIVLVSYFLLSEMFNKKLALFSSIGLTFSWIILFFTGRPLTDIPSAFFLLLSTLFFWKGYVLKKGNKYLYLFGAFFALTVLTRMQLLMFSPAFLILIFTKEKFKFLRNKHLWITLGIFFLFLTPHLIMYWQNYGNPVKDIMGYYFGIEGIAETGAHIERTTDNLFMYVIDLPYILGGQLALGRIIFFMFLIGAFLFFTDLFLGFDKIFKNEEVQKKIFIFLWIAIPFLVLGYITDYVEQRYIISTLPFLFLIAFFPLLNLENYFSKKNISRKKYLLFILAIIVVILIPNMIWGNQLIDAKKTSYYEIMQSAFWLRENTNPGDVIISQSYPQITYYAERSTYSPNYKQTGEEGLYELIEEVKPKYYMLSAIERSEDWTYDFPQSNTDLLIPVWIYPPNTQQPLVIIYEFDYS